MKTAFFRTVFLLLTLGFVFAALAATAHEEKKSNKRNDHAIRIKKEQNQTPIGPRMPERTAIECMYEAASESLSFQFFEAMGGVTVTVVNTTTGEMFFDCCSSTPGACRVALSGDAGAYSIFLEDDFGRTYSGSFTL